MLETWNYISGALENFCLHSCGIMRSHGIFAAVPAVFECWRGVDSWEVLGGWFVPPGFVV